MSAVRTIEFLPRFFRTRANNKFLSATLDQVVSEPRLTRLNGYVGRKNAINARRTDNYLPEISESRSQYQLEPSVVGKDRLGSPNFVSGYQDLLNKLAYLGSDITDQSRLFSGEFYSYSGLIDFDKFVNFSQYYWLPNGPDRVNVFGTEVLITNEFEVTADEVSDGYLFNTTGDVLNPVITIARGGSYTFRTTDTSRKFYIQTEPGIDGLRSRQRNLSSREVLGVYNNGTAEVTFNVPERSAQDYILQMERIDEVDLAVTVKYSEIQGKRFSDVLKKLGGLDGQRNLVGKKIIFLNDQLDFDSNWDVGGVYDKPAAPYDVEAYDASVPVPAEQRYGIWQINNDTNPDAIIEMKFIRAVNVNQKVLVREGNINGNKEFYKNTRGRFQELPAVTAIQDVLYYQDADNPNFVGEIKLVNPASPVTIDVNKDILGKKQYRSPNGVLFTNGLKIQFDLNVTPATYADKTYYVEGVGSAIRLIDEDLLTTPELYMKNKSIGYDQDLYDSDTFETVLSAPVDQSYLVINRASIDLNPWSRGNRWFHQDVITATSKYNNYVPIIDQNARASRPIIEFEADLELYNFARMGKATVTLLDNVQTDALSNVEGQSSYQIDGVDLTPGMRVVFAADSMDSVRNHIYDVSFIDPQGDGNFQIHLTVAADGVPEVYDGIIVAQGDTRQGKCYWFNGDSWVESQQRTGISTAPLFNVFDNSGRSFGDTSKYTGTNFSGTKVFSYKQGTGTTDPILRFPLTYRNFQNVGDIVFENNFVTDTFSYSQNGETTSARVSAGYVHRILDRFTFDKKNTWEKISENSKQYQVFSFEYTGSNKFVTGILPVETGNVPSSKLFINNVLQPVANYRFIVEYTIPKIEVLVPLNSEDKIDLYLYSTDISRLAYFQVPSNLDNNSVNENFETITLGQMRNHVEQVFANSVDTTGAFPGASNIRDLSLKDNPGRILQHSAPTIFASLFLTHPTADFEKSLDYARREYTRFKNKFLEAAYNLGDLDTEDPVSAVDQIMLSLNSYKTSDMPWFRSDMVPYGSDFDLITHVVEDSDKDNYEIFTVFDDTNPSNRAILVYVNGVQLVKHRDYSFASDRPALLFTGEYKPPVGAVIKIFDYRDTDGNWIPETPTKLGLYPSFTPEIVLDKTYRDPTNVIIGHDGSRTVAFGDFRDQILLELEKRIYNNIKVRYDTTRLDINEFLPGKFRKQLYSLSNISRLLSTYFLKWVGTNRLNYTENPYYDNNDGFTWCYRGFIDKLEGEPLPGFWRGIYRYFYDTERPNMTPWEMLGFTEQPSWWVNRYGPAPYTSGNLVLWRDLEDGRILEGPRAGIDPNYARPGLSQVIPVNEYGDMLSPHEFIVKEYVPYNTNLSFTVGDVGPVESAWRNSSEYPFAVQHTMALLNPAKYFGIQIDTANYIRDQDVSQYISRITRQRLLRSDIFAHGEEVSGSIVRAAGYLNWIADYARNLGLSVEDSVGSLVRNFDVQLSYKFAGFTDKKLLKVFAEQASPSSTNSSVLIPDEDYVLLLDKSVPTKLVKYSAVIIRKTNAGWSVEGYDLENPFFTVIPSDANSRRQENDIAGVTYSTYEKYVDELVIIPYGYEFFSRQQVVDFLRGYGRFLSQEGFKFDRVSPELKELQDWNLSIKEFINWSAQGWNEGNIIVLSPVYDVISLASVDATLDAVNDPTSTNRLLDVNFRPYNVKDISVSRMSGESEIVVNASTIGFAELNLVQFEHVAVFNNITVFNDILYQPSLGNRQSRLKLVGSKTADWNGTLSAPGFILNQDNISEWQPGLDYKKADLVSYKNQLYVAASNIPATEEFRYTDWIVSDYNKIKTGLLPNFATRSKQIEDSYNLENINLESDIDTLSKGLIGFRSRKYLTDIGVDDASQVKFYQGFIREKGTRNAIDAFTSARLDRLTSDIKLYEDWAIRVGEYGALDSTQFIEIPLDEGRFSRSPSFLTLLDSGDTRPLDRVGFKAADLYRKPKDYRSNLFMTRPAGRDYNFEINVAGPVRLDDVDYTVFNMSDIQTLTTELSNIGAGTLIWVASDDVQEWNVFRVDQTNAVVTQVVNAVGGYIFFQTATPHGLEVGDYIVVKNISNVFDGFYKIAVVPSESSMLVEFDTATINGFEAALDLRGYILKLVSVKFEQASDAASLNLTTGWDVGDLFWVDNGSDQTPWQVYKKTEPWEEINALDGQGFAGSNFLGTQMSMSADGNVIAATCDDPVSGNSDGHIKIWVKDGNSYTDQIEVYSASGTLLPDGIRRGPEGASSVIDLSVVVSSTGDFIVDSYDKSLSGRGAAGVYVRRGDALEYEFVTGITAAEGFSSTDAFEFGDSLALSKDDSWLFIGAPGIGDETPNTGRVYAMYRGTYDDKTYFYHLGNTASIMPSDLQVGDRFGDAISVSTDGAQVVIAAPNHDNGDGTTGAVYVYDRIIEAFLVTAENTVEFATVRGINENKVRVTVDQLPVDPSEYTIDYPTKTVTFNIAPDVGSVVRIEVNEFALIQKLTGSNAFEGLGYGSSVAMCYNNCSIYVGSPNVNSDNSIDRDTGLVYRYINQGRVYGTIVGEVINPSVNVGDSIRIDDFEITFTGTTLNDVIADINNYGIPGITASADAGRLKIVEDSKQTFSKLRILPGVGSALTDIGLKVFVEIQQIKNPVPTERGRFGSSLAINQDSDLLTVGAPYADSVTDFVMDGGITIFDDRSTTFSTTIKRSGAAYVFEQLPSTGSSIDNPSQYVLAQRLTSSVHSSGDGFGTSIAIGGDYTLISSPGDDTIATDAGMLTLFKDTIGEGAWAVLRSESDYVEIESINSVFLYNRITGRKLASLDFIDPAKGKILGIAAQEIDFITEADPAYYNLGDTEKVLPEISWGPEQVGKIWWDISAVRYMDYEQGDFAYRSNNWGKMFPGSRIKVYQWVESLVPPSGYSLINPSGFPKSPNDTEFVERQTIDKYTGGPATRYYFWVEGLTSTLSSDKNLSISEIAELISNPSASKRPYAAFLSPSTIGLWNIDDLLVDSDVILHVDYDVVKNDNIIHSEFQLVQENSESSNIPSKIVRKFIDSLCGQDAAGNPVPDPALSYAESVGVSFRPRQSAFRDQKAALRVFVDRVNALMLETPIFEVYGLNSHWNAQEPLPDQEDAGWSEVVPDVESLNYLRINTRPAGYRVLVTFEAPNNGWAVYEKVEESSTTWAKVQEQSFNTSNYWRTVDWYKPGISANNVKPDYVVGTEYEVAVLNPRIGQVIKVNNSGNGKFKIYQVADDGTLEVIGIQAATVQVSDALWIQQPPLETRNILIAIQETYAGTVINNQILFALIRYALSEQQYIDWAFKTSFVSVLHRIRQLEQFTNYQRDNQDYVEEFINEVKPYRTKIREYLLSYASFDNWDGAVTDFDLPGYYDTDFLRFRSPSGEKNKDLEEWEKPQNADWFNNYTMSVDSVVIYNGGSEYTIRPKVEITGGGGAGATAVAAISNGRVVRILVTNPGSGYTSNPSVVITGGNGSGAVASVRLKNDTTRKIKTTIKFDRVDYSHRIVEWAPSTEFTVGSIVRYENEVYTVKTTFTSGTTFDGTNLEIFADEQFTTANDRVMAYYQPGVGMPSRELSQVFAGIDYPGVRVTGRVFTDVAPTEVSPDGTTMLAASNFDTLIGSQFTDFSLGTRPEDINIAGGSFVDTFSSHAPEELIPGIIFDTLDLKVFTITNTLQEREGAGPEIYMFAFTGDGIKTTYDISILGKNLDNIIVYNKTGGNLREGVDFTYNRQERTITFASVPDSRDQIYIYLLGDASQYELYDSEIFGDGSTKEFKIPVVEYSLITDSFVVIDGNKTLAYSLREDVGGKTKIVFDTAPTPTQYVRVYLFGGESGVQHYSEIYSQYVTLGENPVYPRDYTISLDRELRYAGPLSSNIILEVNSQRMRPANSRYYTGDGVNLVYEIPSTVDIDPDTISDNDIEVYLNGVRQIQNIHYDVVPSDGVSLRTIEFYVAPTTADEVTVALMSGAEFRINNRSELLISEKVNLSSGDEIKIISFSNHDPIKIRTQVFIGSNDETIANEPGFDAAASPFDVLRFDGTDSVVVNRPVYELSRPANDSNYLWVTVNGTRQLPNYDFTLRDPTTLLFGQHLRITQDDVIVITSFSESVYSQALGFRTFKDMLGETYYYRISQEASSRLSEDLNINDTEIKVVDARAFAEPSPIDGVPGVVFIDGERITYFSIDYENNTLGRLRRGTSGTGAATIHPAGTIVVSSGKDQEVPYSKDVLSTHVLLGDGSTTSYEFDDVSIVDSRYLQVYVGGILLDSAQYSVTSTAPVAITLVDPVPDGQEIVVAAKFGQIWYDMSNSNLSLSASGTMQARFLKEKPSFIPA